MQDNRTTRTQNVTRAQLKEIIVGDFGGQEEITIEDLHAALELRGMSFVPTGSNSAVYQILYEAGFLKVGDAYRLRTVKSVKPLTSTTVFVGSSVERTRARAALVMITPSVSVAPPALPIPRTDFEDGEPRVRDTDLGTFLGYSNPRKIREIIERHSEALGVRPTVGRTQKVGIATRVVSEEWLTEHQAIYIVAKSETPIANAILQQVIDVFVKVRRGAVAVQTAPSGFDLAPLLAVLVDLVSKIGAQQVSTPAPVPAAKSRPERTPAGDFTGWLNTHQWAAQRGVVTSQAQRSELGLQASKTMRAGGLEIGKMPSARFGTVNVYPPEVLDGCWQGRRQ